jgi:protein disulfide-isomerase-like protein
VKIANVDADEHKDLSHRYDVSGFPTLKYFPAGSTVGETYSGGRTAPDLVDFVNKKTGLNGRVKEAPTSVVVLTADNFDSIVKDETKNVLVEFYAPWCGHCKKLAPDYDKVGQSFDGENNVVIAKLDADAHKETASGYDVSGYPTLLWFPRDNKAGVAYEGGRTPKDFVEFVNREAGTDRTVGGGFTEKAGRISALDELSVRFVGSSSAAERKQILAEATTFVDTLAATAKNAENAKFYTISMKKLLENPNYATEELARLARISTSGSITAEKTAQFAKRINIINLFK